MFKFLAMIFCATTLFAAAPNFTHSHEFKLYKDEWARVKMRQKGREEFEYFDFRWTLFDSQKLTIQSFFRRHPRHFVLKYKFKQNRYVQQILPGLSEVDEDAVKLYVSFIKFKDKMAEFRVDVLDAHSRVELEFLEPKR